MIGARQSGVNVRICGYSVKCCVDCVLCAVAASVFSIQISKFVSGIFKLSGKRLKKFQHKVEIYFSMYSSPQYAAGCWLLAGPAPCSRRDQSWHLLQLNSAKFYVLGHLPKAPWPRILGKTRKNFFAEMQLISSRQQWAVTNHVVLWFLLEVEYLFSPQWYSQNNLKYVFWSISYSQGTMSGLKLLWPPSKPSLQIFMITPFPYITKLSKH